MLEFPSYKWRMVPSDSLTTPQQLDRTSCGVFMLMFAELLADGQNVDRFDAASCSQARTHIASGLLRGLRHNPTKIPKGQVEIRSRPTTETTCSRASTTTSGTSQSTFVPLDTRSVANDWDIALASLADLKQNRRMKKTAASRMFWASSTGMPAPNQRIGTEQTMDGMNSIGERHSRSPGAATLHSSYKIP